MTIKGGKPKRALKADAKRTAKFKASGGLERELKDRKKYKQVKAKIDTRKALRSRKTPGTGHHVAREEEDVEDGPAPLTNPA
jgi:hypothetical protein